MFALSVSTANFLASESRAADVIGTETQPTNKTLQAISASKTSFISQFPLRARQLAGDARVVPARGVHRARERLEQRLDDVMRLVAVTQFEVQIAARLVRKALKKFARESEPERARSVLIFFRVGNFLLRKFVQPAP